jgi:MFS family permease
MLTAASLFPRPAIGGRHPGAAVLASSAPRAGGAAMALRVTDANRSWWVLIAMTGSLSMVLLDQTVVSVALPSIQRDLDLSQTQLQWVVNAYLLAIAALVAVGGRLSDMVDRVKVFLLGVVVFAATSALAGVAIDEAWILIARGIQGVGAALMIPASAALVVNAFPVEGRGRAMGIYAGVSMIFLSLGPLVGGLLTEWTWRAVFWINVPVAIVTVLTTLAARPDGRVRGGQRLDVPGLVALCSPAAFCSCSSSFSSRACASRSSSCVSSATGTSPPTTPRCSASSSG